MPARHEEYKAQVTKQGYFNRRSFDSSVLSRLLATASTCAARRTALQTRFGSMQGPGNSPASGQHMQMDHLPLGTRRILLTMLFRGPKLILFMVAKSES